MWLVVGGDSEIGAAIYGRLLGSGRPAASTTRRQACVGPDRPLLDLADPLDAWEPPPGVRAACLCAAVSKFAACDRDPVGSAYINVTQTLALCERLLARGIYVLFLSTNQVFDGSAPYVPAGAPTAPVSEYGRLKTAAEAVLRREMDRGAAIAVLRLAKVISPQLPLIRDWTAKLRANQPVGAFYDMTLAPAPIGLVVDVVIRLLADEARGIFQLTGPEDITYVEFARHLARRLGSDLNLVQPVSAAAAGMPVGSTPRYTTLDSSLVRERYGIAAPAPSALVDAIVGSGS